MEGCLFCDIANRKIDARIVFEDEKVIAFNDIAPQSPVHILVIPKKHILSLTNVESREDYEYVAGIFSAMKKIVEEKNLDRSGFRVVVNHGKNAGQAVPHLHFHILGGRKLNWPPG